MLVYNYDQGLFRSCRSMSSGPLSASAGNIIVHGTYMVNDHILLHRETIWRRREYSQEGKERISFDVGSTKTTGQCAVIEIVPEMRVDNKTASCDV